MLVLSREQVRKADRIAIDEYKIPGVVLMENAGRSVADEVLALGRTLGFSRETIDGWQPVKGGAALHVAVLCGGGNNGGDGYVIARHLHNAGVIATVYAAIDPVELRGDAAINRAIIDTMELPRIDILDDGELNAATPELEKAHILVDALLGTGFKGEVRPHLANVIRRCNALALNDKKVVAVDVPSGLDCDTGAPSNSTVRADVTVTFVAMKKGFANMNAKPYTGRVVVAGIGAPRELIDRILA